MMFVTHHTHTHTHTNIHTHSTGEDKLEQAFLSPFTQVNHRAVVQTQLGFIHPKHSFMETENITVSILNIHNNYADL